MDKRAPRFPLARCRDLRRSVIYFSIIVGLLSGAARAQVDPDAPAEQRRVDEPHAQGVDPDTSIADDADEAEARVLSPFEAAAWSSGGALVGVLAATLGAVALGIGILIGVALVASGSFVIALYLDVAIVLALAAIASSGGLAGAAAGTAFSGGLHDAWVPALGALPGVGLGALAAVAIVAGTALTLYASAGTRITRIDGQSAAGGGYFLLAVGTVSYFLAPLITIAGAGLSGGLTASVGGREDTE